MGLGIRIHDNPLRIWVPSETRPGLEHLVELSAYKNNGECTCEHFYNRCGPKLKKGAVPGPLLRCNHIERARDFFIGIMLTQITDRADTLAAADIAAREQARYAPAQNG